MAITRAQQARQLYIKGGQVFPDGRRGFGGGADMGTVSGTTPGSSANKGLSGGYQGGPKGGYGDAGRDGPTDKNPYDKGKEEFKKIRKEQKEKYEKQFFDKGKVPPLGSRPTSFKTKLNQFNLQKRLNYINNLQKQIRNKLNKGLIDYQEEEGQIQGLTDFDTLESYIDKVQSVQDLVDKGFYKPDGQFAKGEKIPDFPSTDMPGVLGIAQDFFSGPVTSDKLKQLNEQLTKLEGLKTTEGLESTTFKDLMKEYQPNRFEREYGDPKDDRGPDQQMDPCKGPNPPAYCFIGENVTEETDPTNIFAKANITPRIAGSLFAADGGRIGAMDGGIMNVEDLDREAFLLGGIAKGLKKAVRGVKKLAKSPIGKVALLAAGAGYGGFGPLKGVFSGMKGAGFLKSMAVNKSLLGTSDYMGGPTGILDLIRANPMESIFAASALAGLMTSKQDDGFNIDQYYADNKLNPNAPLNKRIAGSEFDFYGGQTAADGGRIGYQEGSKEPVAKKTLPLIDMDGMEKDYRETGGFVEMGRMEKADDVPARLSKNEFVFTADAVRNAGEGDIDKGAEVMYNMMKNLEAGGEVSEESQGLEGAREMFQTSQRLGEVI